MSKLLNVLLDRWWKRMAIDSSLLAANVWVAFNQAGGTIWWPTWLFIAAMLAIMAADATVTYRRRRARRA